MIWGDIRPKNFINYFLAFHPSRKPNMKEETRIVPREKKERNFCEKEKQKHNVVRNVE
jgi:hypothetical protein